MVLAVTPLWSNGRTQMLVSLKFSTELTSAAEPLVQMDLSLQTRFEAMKDLSSTSRLPPPFCPTAMHLYSSKIAVFPDAIVDTSGVFDQNAAVVALNPEDFQRMTECVVGLGYVLSLVEPTISIDLFEIPHSAIVDELKLRRIEFKATAAVHHRETELLSDSILFATVPATITMNVRSIEAGQSGFTDAESEFVTRWWKDCELGQEVQLGPIIRGSALTICTSFTWEVKLCSPDQPTI